MNQLYKRQQGAGIIKTIALIPLVIIGFAILFFIYTEINKAYWDHRVKELCEKDGGVIVYERVSLLREEHPNLKFTSKGGVILPSERKVKLEDAFFRRFTLTYIQINSPRVWRERWNDIKYIYYVCQKRRGLPFRAFSSIIIFM